MEHTNHLIQQTKRQVGLVEEVPVVVIRAQDIQPLLELQI